MMKDNKDSDNNNSDNSNDYLESSEERRRKHHKFKDFDNYNNKYSVRAFLSSVMKKNPNFSLKHLSPENLLKIYNCYLTNDDIPPEIDFNSNNNTQDTSTTQSTKTEEEDDSSGGINIHDDHFALKKQKNKLNILKDFQKGNQADAREFLFSYFELTNSPLLSTKAFSIMVIDGSKDEAEEDKKNTEYDDDDDDDEVQDNSNISSILINKFIKNTGSFEVFVDHYATIVSPCEGKSYESNNEFIETRILQFKSVTTILINYPSMISRIPKILKKFAPILFSLLKQSDFSTSIEAFRCIVAMYSSKSNIVKKKTKRKWLEKLATYCLPDSPLLNLIANFIINQKLIKFEFPTIPERLIEKSVLSTTRKKNLQKNQKTDEDYISCSELSPYDECYDGACSFEILNAIELTLMKIAQIRDKKLKKLKLFMNNDSDDQSNDQSLSVDEFDSEEFSSNDVKKPISFLFNTAIEDTIFGKAALKIIINVLIAFSTKSKILPGKNDKDKDKDADPIPPSFVLVWSVFLIRKSIVMFSIAERSGNFKLFERRSDCIQNICYSIFENKDSIHKYVISSMKKIIRASLLCRKNNKTENKYFASISKLAKKLGINATSNELTLDDVDGYTKNFLCSMKSELIEDEELTQFVHFPFDEETDSSLMEE